MTRSLALTAATLVALLDNGCANGVDPARPSDLDSSVLGSSGSGGVPIGPTGGSGGTVVRPGTGGSTAGGTGGVSNSGGAGGGAGGTASGTGGGPPIPPAIGDLKVQYLAAGAVDDKEVKPHFNIVNTGSKAIPLADLTIRYFYTADGPPSGTDYQTLQLDYAKTSGVKLSFGQYTPAKADADTYLEVGFTGTGTIGQETGEIQTRVNWKGYTQTYDERNDYSWDGTRTSFVDWPKATLYQRGVLVWGREPDGTVPDVGDAGGGGSGDGSPQDAGAD